MKDAIGNALMVSTLIVLNTFLQSDYMIEKMNDNVWSFMNLDENSSFDRLILTLVHLIVFVVISATGGAGILALTQDLTKQVATTAASLKK